MKIRTDIIPPRHETVGVRDVLDLQAICAFAAVGYFPSDDTYYKGCRSLPPASYVTLDGQGSILRAEPYFKWHHSPRDMSLEQAVDEFAHLFEGILSEDRTGEWTIPISGGLDSRTLVAAAHHLRKPFKGYGYSFRDRHPEARYGRRMSESLGFGFHEYTIEPGTLWKDLEKLAGISQCYAEFTHPRQFCVFSDLQSLGGTFLLGHWGDVLFDDMHVPDDMPLDRLFDLHLRRIVKPLGLQLGDRLWKAWGLQGSLTDYLRDTLKSVFDAIDIREPNPRLRAFKSWTHAIRWTNTNLAVFREFGPNLYPYMDNRMVEFICTVPEKWLSGRRIQIEYIKRRSSSLAKLPWQSHYPFNLYDHRLDRPPLNLPFKVYGKLKRTFSGRPTVSRNWELQFVGRENEQRLREMLTGQGSFCDWIPESITRHYLEAFLVEKSVDLYHPVSMLLTLSAFDRYLSKGSKGNQPIKTKDCSIS